MANRVNNTTEKRFEYDPSTIPRKLPRIQKPTVFKNMLRSWTSVPWTFEELVKRCGSTVLKFRVVNTNDQEGKAQADAEQLCSKFKEGEDEPMPKCFKHDRTDPFWEGEGQCVQTELRNFVDWVEGRVPSDLDENPFNVYDLESHWVYSSYNYMKQCFPEKSPIMKAVDWSPFGFTERDGKESTLWLGSTGSYTPCHIDTYGYNLVAQIIGKKQWVLFPPEDTSKLYLSRVPYEESTIFSVIDISNPNLHHFPWFKFTHPYVVTLEPGDVLYVPNKWWHYVKSLEPNMSINTWIEMDEDHETRLEEAVVKALMSIIVPMCDCDASELCWVNPKEELVRPSEIEQLVKTALNKYMQQFKTTSSSSGSDLGSSDEGEHSAKESLTFPSYVSENMVPVPELKFEDFYQKCCQKASATLEDTDPSQLAASLPPDPVHLKSIVNCFVHPDVVSCISQKLMELANASLYCSI